MISNEVEQFSRPPHASKSESTGQKSCDHQAVADDVLAAIGPKGNGAKRAVVHAAPGASGARLQRCCRCRAGQR